uniref:Pre-mRNA splicing Prp18-interacting factor n=1 Tax=Tanacetum cinerariifolium TaxID=118510 RepID=A0A699KR41_TANCI|nr:hypothetical protein [Tanacetum cinerariifolium]
MSTFVLCVGCEEPLYGFSPCRWCTCERCGIDMLNGIRSLCYLSNSCAYDHNQNSFDFPPDSYHPLHPTYETYSGDTCGNDSHFGYDCSPQFPLNYEPEPGYIQNYNSYPHDSPSFSQQYPCCEDCGVTHEPYQCQPKNHDYYHVQNSCCDSNPIGFDQYQPQQYTVNHPIFNTHHDYLDSQKELSITLTKLKEQMTSFTSFCEMACQIVQKKQEEKRIEEQQAAKAQNWKFSVCYDDDDDEEGFNSLQDNIISELPSITPTKPVDSLIMEDEHLDTIPATKSDEFIKSCQAAKAQNWKFSVCYDDDDDEEGFNSLQDNIISELPSCSAITPTKPVDSLIMEDEHLDTIPATKSDEFIKSCVENLVPNPSDSEGENECDVPAGFTTFSNVLFNADYDSDSSYDQSLSDEDIDSLFDEFVDELTLLKSFPPEIDETDCHPEKEIRFAKRLLYDNSPPHPPEEIISDNSNADIESFSPSPIPNEDSDSHMEEIDLPFTPDDPMPPGIEDDDYDSGRDILILEELLDNYSFSLPNNESYHFDIPSPYRPPTKPPDGNTGTEKSPDLLSHLGLEAFQPSAECQTMIINGKNIPLLDAPLFHFYPLDQLKETRFLVLFCCD